MQRGNTLPLGPSGYDCDCPTMILIANYGLSITTTTRQLALYSAETEMFSC